MTVSCAAQTLGTFNLTELFGVSYPDQPIEFRYDGGNPGSMAKMIGPASTEVAYQWVSSCSDTTAVLGCIAVRGSLAANASNTWTLTTGVPSATPTNPVSMATVGNNIEITNGLTGVRVITQAANGSPFNKAPIQGIQLADGTWTGAGGSANLLYSQSMANEGNVGDALKTAMYLATGYTLTVTDSGPMKTVITLNYTFTRPQYFYPPSTVINEAGTGHYTLIVTMYANSKSVLFDEDTDMSFSYYLPMYTQLTPDTARWRGANSNDNNAIGDPFCGYSAALTVTSATAASPMVITTSPSGTTVNGNSVVLAGVLNADSSTIYFLKKSGHPAGEFGVYTDTALTMPFTGTGSYSGGGIAKPSYLGQFLYPTPDAYQDLTYTGDRPASYNCAGVTNYRKLLSGYPPGANAAGWYVEMYNSGGMSTDPVVGFYTGRASKQVYSAIGPSLPGMYTSNSDWITHAQAADIEIDSLLRSPSGSTVCPVALPCSLGGAPNAIVHRNWGIFVSTQADLLSPTVHQPIANEQNELTGINLSRLYTYQLVYPDPPGGWQWLYLTSAGAAQLISWVQNGTSKCGSTTCYATLLSNSLVAGDTWGASLISMWTGNSTAAVQTALNSANTLAATLETVLAAGDNHYDGPLGYYQLGLQTSPETAVLNAIIMNPNTTTTQKNQAKAELALFGSIFWDDDWFPIDNNSGESYGLANQIEQYLQYRTQSAFSTSSQPFLGQQLMSAANNATGDFSNYFDSTGAAAGSTHYQSAFFEPLVLNYMNPATQGYLSISDPKWAANAAWELSIQTPPEPRYGNIRKGESNGDGNTEGDVRTGMLGTALHAANPPLAGNLMWAWNQSNTSSHLVEDSQFVTTIAVIDTTVPAVTPGTGGTPPLASINIPGYHSVERFNFGTANETAAWFINGDFYQIGGHRHYDDGQVSIYALSAPLAIDWNANLYEPETPGRWVHDSIVFNSELTPKLWSDDNTGLSLADTLFSSAVNAEFESFNGSTHSAANFTWSDGTVWTRSVRTMNFDPNYPLIYVKDTFSGASAAASKTLTWNMMATGAVSTPAGPITPTTRFSTGCQSPAGQLPSNGSVNSLSSGLNNFNFTGFTWAAHPAGGINWDLWINAPSSSQQFLIGNWGHGCAPTPEAAQYLAANGTSFAEVQDILRVNDTGAFTTLIGPYDKGATPTRTVTTQTCGIQVVQGSEATCFNDDAATWTNGTTNVLTAYDASSATAFGTTVVGGSQEVTLVSGRVTWVLNGAATGTRQLTLTGNWMPNPIAVQSLGTFTYPLTGALQSSPVTVVMTPFVNGFW